LCVGVVGYRSCPHLEVVPEQSDRTRGNDRDRSDPCSFICRFSDSNRGDLGNLRRMRCIDGSASAPDFDEKTGRVTPGASHDNRLSARGGMGLQSPWRRGRQGNPNVSEKFLPTVFSNTVRLLTLHP
jgi:hypothetical protein